MYTAPDSSECRCCSHAESSSAAATWEARLMAPPAHPGTPLCSSELLPSEQAEPCASRYSLSRCRLSLSAWMFSMPRYTTSAPR